ncbi:MAG: alpha-amylase family glycosyl hydrolase [Treponema sp.]|nr:alpha-amylase family glycosyl hydrolase [Treponema sp.]
MKKLNKKLICGFVSALMVTSAVCAKSGIPGTYEDAAPAELKKVLAVDSKINPADDELVVYYLRSDGDYEPWGLWIWALPGGDGNAMWEYSQKWEVTDGVGYMRFKLDGSSTGGNKPVSADGTVGLIVRQDDGWVKDGNDDREWNIGASKKVAIISGNQETFAATAYKPSFKTAELVSTKSINMVLSGAYAIDTDGGASGFSVKTTSGKSYKIASVKNTVSANAADNMTDKITITLAEDVNISEEIVVSNPVFMGNAKVNSQKLAIELAEKTVPEKDVVLGAEYKKGSVVFNLWAPTSSKVTANLYKADNAKSPDFTVPLTKNEKTGLWTGTFNKVDADGFFYDYTVTNSMGTNTVLDPYAKSMAAYHNDGTSGRGAIVDLTSSKAMPEGGMNAPFVKLAQREDAVIYEISVRDFTIGNDSSVSSVPGTYKAFIEKIPYLKKLGITHVQLQPVLNFYYNDETDKSYDDRGVVNNSNYNWGYDPHNYFTPEGWFATDASDPYCRVRELRELVNECHKAGIGVLLDVVYNHMAGTQFLEPVVPGYYFRTDANGKFKSNSGCGNDTATERVMMAKIVEDSTKYWVENYKVDGFRFDLMGLMEAECVLKSYEECKKINPDVLFEGEGWKMYNGAAGTVGMDQGYMRKTDSVACFNDDFRDAIKAGGFNESGTGLITGKDTNMADLFRSVMENPKSYGTDDPGDNVQYTTCHDGLTLHDCVAHNAMLNESNPAEKAEIISRIKLGNTIVLTSQGIAFLHGGQERGRTKPNVLLSKNETVGKFVRNSYDSSDNINQIVWTLDDDYQNLYDFTEGLIALRKSTTAFRLGNKDKIKQCAELIPTEDKGLVFAYVIHNDDGEWIVAVNAGTKNAVIKTQINMKNAEILVDRQSAGTEKISAPKGVKIVGKKLGLEPLTATVIHVK